MKKLILVYGVISGLVIIVINTLSIELGIAHVWLGFLVMFIAFSSIFFAVKQYRDEALGGVIRFGTGFLLGLGITLIASLVYVLVWELYLALTDYAFIEVYISSIVESRQAAGASQAELAATDIASREARNGPRALPARTRDARGQQSCYSLVNGASDVPLSHLSD